MQAQPMIKLEDQDDAQESLIRPIWIFVWLSSISIMLLVAQSILGGIPLTILTDPIAWLSQLDNSESLSTLSTAAEVVATVLAIAITVVAIVVELAANRYSHEITRLFLREPTNLIAMGVLVITTVNCFWLAAIINPNDPGSPLSQAGFAITLGLTTLCLLGLVPYIYYVFTFLSPISIIKRICRDAYKNIIRAQKGDITKHQNRVESAIDELQDVARSAITQGDRSIAMTAVNAMKTLLMDYERIRGDMPAQWFDVTQQVAQDPDFIALAPESMAEVKSQGVWLERKIFRRYLSLMGQSALQARDIANLIGINTQQIATQLGPTNPNLLVLCIRSFNSYLRATINAGDLRTAYYLLNQYRLIGESLLTTSQEEKALEVASYLKDYGQLAHKMGFSFLLDAAAYDVLQLIEKAVNLQSGAIDGLIECLVQLDLEIKEDNDEETQLGVRRAQIQAAVLFMELKQDARVEIIVNDLKDERKDRLERIRRGLLTDEREQYWELMDRGANFAYMKPSRRIHLKPLFELLNITPDTHT